MTGKGGDQLKMNKTRGSGGGFGRVGGNKSGGGGFFSRLRISKQDKIAANVQEHIRAVRAAEALDRQTGRNRRFHRKLSGKPKKLNLLYKSKYFCLFCKQSPVRAFLNEQTSRRKEVEVVVVVE